MSLHDDGFALLLPDAQHWRESNIMKIPNANLLQDLGGDDRLGGRLWRLPPFSANTWHKQVDSSELYFLLEGLGRMRIGENIVTVPKYGCVLVAPQMLRQVFNDTPEDPAPRWSPLASIHRILSPSRRRLPAECGRRSELLLGSPACS